MSTRYPGRCLIAAIAIGLGGAAAHAADKIELSLDQLPYNASGQAGLQNALTDRTTPNALTSLLGGQESFALDPERKTGKGEQRERGQQTYRGVKVHGAEFIATRNSAGRYTFISGNVLQNIDRDVKSVSPRLTASSAERRAQNAFRASSGVPANLSSVTFTTPTELMIYQRDDGVAVLAYRVEFGVKAQPGQLPHQPVTFLDANTGQVISQYDNLQHVEERGRGPGGNQRMGQIEHGNSELGVDGFTTVNKTGTTCQLSNSKTRVMDAQSGTNTSSTTPKSFTCSDSTNRYVEGTINGAYGVLNDILYNGTRTVDMYREWFNVFPLTCGSILNQYGHYDRNLDNAYWQNCKMHYGDGSSFHPLVSMDVVSHEIGHGVTEGRSRLTYSGQSGGLNESFSDMAGVALVYYLTGSTDWKIGSQIKKSSGQLRCMDNPPCDGRSIKHVSNYTNGMDVHFSSGVYNHAFYLLANRPGWNPKKAFEVYYKANDLYWTSSTNFAQAGEGACRAAKDLGYNGDDVKASLQTVGVNPTTCEPGTGDPDTPIQNGVPVTGISLTLGQEKFYKLAVTAGATNLQFVTSGGTGNANIYVKFGSRPTTTDNVCRGEQPGNAETCSIATAQTGTYYVMVRGASASSGVSLTGSFTGDPGGGETVLQNGVPVSGISLTLQEQKFYRIDVPAGASGLRFATTGGSGDADLYVKFGSRPTTTDNVCRSESPTSTETCNIATAQAGTYFVLLYGYSAASNVTLTASFTTSSGGETVLQNGVPVSGITLSTGQERFYTLDVPAGRSSVQFRTTGSSGDVDLYVRAGSRPTTTSFTCKSDTPTNTETCTINSPAAGTYYVLLYGYAATSGVTLTGTY